MFRSRTISQTFFQLVARMFSTVVNFILIFLVARRFGSDGLGSYNKVFSFIAFFALFVDFGLNSVFIKLTDYKKRFMSLLLLRLFLSLLFLIILQPFLFLLPFNPVNQTGFSLMEKIYIEIIGFSLVLYSFIHSFMAIVQKERVYERTIFPQILFAGVVLSVGMIGYYTNNLLLFFLATIFGLLAQIFGLTRALRLYFNRKADQYQLIFSDIRASIKDLFRKSIPVGATLFLNSLYVRIDVFLLALFRPTADVGVYTLAYKFFEFPLIFSFFIMNALYPQMVQVYKNGIRELQIFIIKRMGWIIGFAFVLTILAYFSAPFIVFIKNDFVGSISVFRVLSLSYPIFFASNLLLWMIIALNRENILPAVYFISLMVNMLLNMIYIPRYGYIASAWITVFTEGLVLVMFSYYTARIRE